MPKRTQRYGVHTNGTVKYCQCCKERQSAANTVQCSAHAPVIDITPLEHFEEYMVNEPEPQWVWAFRPKKKGPPSLSLDKLKRWQLLQPEMTDERVPKVAVSYHSADGGFQPTGWWCNVPNRGEPHDRRPLRPASTLDQSGNSVTVRGNRSVEVSVHNPSKRVAAVKRAARAERHSADKDNADPEGFAVTKTTAGKKGQKKAVRHKKGRSDCMCEDCVNGVGEAPPSAMRVFLEEQNSSLQMDDEIHVQLRRDGPNGVNNDACKLGVKFHDKKPFTRPTAGRQYARACGPRCETSGRKFRMKEELRKTALDGLHIVKNPTVVAF
eukprot:GFYU01000011.1.p1 GENE.GFYU01000011.1~~GFYU01000011.1.p1  ORF type:complete len:342 (-),score=34.48 GFYU01000011.1:64-1035(-)